MLFSDLADGQRCVYRISAGEISRSVAGSYPVAYFDRFDTAT